MKEYTEWHTHKITMATTERQQRRRQQQYNEMCDQYASWMLFEVKKKKKSKI